MQAEGVTTAKAPANWLTLPVGAAAFVGALLHVALRDEYFSLVTGVASGLLGALTLLAAVRYLRVRPERFPAVEVMLLLHYLSFALPVTVPPLRLGVWGVLPTQDSYEYASLCALASAGTMLLAAAIAHRLGARVPARPSWIPPLRAPDLGRAAALYVPVCTVWALWYTLAKDDLVDIGATYGAISAFLGRVPWAVIATAALLYAPSRMARIGFLSMVGVALLTMAIKGMLTYAITPLGAAALVWWRVRGRIPVAILAMAAATVLLLQPVKTYYRHARWGNESRVGVVEAWESAFQDAAGAGRLDRGGEETRSRFDELSALAYVIQLVPRHIPHSDGQAYGVIVTAAIPRILWPEKPDMTGAGTDAFTIPLGLQTEDNAQRSAYALSVSPMGYYEHGVAGALGWMALVGFALAMMSKVFGRGAAAEIAAAIVTLSMAMASGAGFAMFFGCLWQWTLITLTLLWSLHIVGALTARLLGNEDDARPRVPSRFSSASVRAKRV